MRPIENRGVDIGSAAVARVDQGYGKSLTLAECVEAVTMMRRPDASSGGHDHCTCDRCF